MLQPGTVFAGYRIERLLGTGGMGAVYLARHPRLPRLDALKVISSTAAADPEFRGRFQREAALVAQFRHPAIVGVYDTGAQDGLLWLSMPFIDGEDAGQLLARTGPQSVESVCAIGRSVAAALDYAHHRGVLHRDVKPANILLERQSGAALLADFGIARELGGPSDLTATGMTIGTVDFASPEQLTGEPLTAASDVYSLAATLFTLLTGQVPFPAESAAAKIGAHLYLPPPCASATGAPLSSGVDEALARGLAKQPADRYGSAGELVRALTAGIGAPPPPITRVLPGTEPPDAAGPSAPRRIGRTAVVAVAAGVLIGALGLAAVLLNGRGSDGAAASPAASATPPAGTTAAAARTVAAPDCTGATEVARAGTAALGSYDYRNPSAHEAAVQQYAAPGFDSHPGRSAGHGEQSRRMVIRVRALDATQIDCTTGHATVKVDTSRTVQSRFRHPDSTADRTATVQLREDDGAWRITKISSGDDS
jgi:hypothetical protein